MKRFFKEWDSLDDRITAVSNLVVAIVLPIILIIFCAIFVNSMHKAIESADEIPLQITSEYVNLSISEAVSAEVDRQLQAINPVRIEFVNVENPIKPATYVDVIPMDVEYQAIMFQAIEEYHIGKGFALALIESESTFDVNATAIDGNGVTYYGAWQISEVNAKRFSEVYGLDITNPKENLVAGAIMLSELIDKYGSKYGAEYVINAYKGGEGAALEWYEEDYVLPCCDEITGRAMFWEEVLKGEEANG